MWQLYIEIFEELPSYSPQQLHQLTFCQQCVKGANLSTSLPKLIIHCLLISILVASPMAQQVKNLPAMQEAQETGVWSLDGKIPWRRKWQPIPVFLSEKSHGQRSLTGYSPWCHTESDMTEWLSMHTHLSGLVMHFILIFFFCQKMNEIVTSMVRVTSIKTQNYFGLTK